MPLQAPQIPCLQLVDIELPPEVGRLHDLAYNFWWSWTPEARRLFSTIDSWSWARYRNPVELLLALEPGHWEDLIADEAFMTDYNAVVRGFDEYMRADRKTWFAEHHGGFDHGQIAYLSMEFGVHQCLGIYSGGLGVLSGDHCKSASDLGLPFVGLGLLYRRGYFRQTIDADGIQQHHYPNLDFARLPLRQALGRGGSPLRVKLPFPGRSVVARVWLVQIGRVPLLLLDTDVRENDPADRPITHVLYVGGREMRLAQEAVLGIGAVAALGALDIDPAVWHLNEGHSALAQFARVRDLVNGGGELEPAVGTVARASAFTTHTPVTAGHEQFAPWQVRPYLEALGFEDEETLDNLMAMGSPHQEPDPENFNLTALALRTAAHLNGVSELNAEVCQGMWEHLLPTMEGGPETIVPITNGVHLPTWLGPEIRWLFRRALGDDWLEALLDPDRWGCVSDFSDQDLAAAHAAQKERLIRFTRTRVLEQLARHGRSPEDLRGVSEMLGADVLTLGFARRFATYKRAGLLFSDRERLRAILAHGERPVQVLIAGKAHPSDRPGQELIQQIFQLSQEADLHGRVVFLEDYDLRVGRMLVQGCDVWLNTPTRPLEASGTSGQKAAINGVLNCSIADGWWPEGHDGDNGWVIEAEDAGGGPEASDAADAAGLYDLLESDLVPTFYERDAEGLAAGWIAMMRASIGSVGRGFAAARMVRDYFEQAYLPLAGRK